MRVVSCSTLLVAALAFAGCVHSPTFVAYKRTALGAPQITDMAKIIYEGDLGRLLACKHMRLGDLQYDRAARDDVGVEAAERGGTHVLLVESEVRHAGTTTGYVGVGNLGVASTTDEYSEPSVWRVYRVEHRDMGCLPRLFWVATAE